MISLEEVLLVQLITINILIVIVPLLLIVDYKQTIIFVFLDIVV